MPVNASNQTQTEMNSLFEPAKCSSPPAACVLISFPPTVLFGYSLARIDRQYINHREDKHPDQIDKVPVEPADLYVFMLEFVDPSSHHQQIDTAGEDVKHVQGGDAK